MSEADSTVTYRPCPGHDGYRVGSDGSVWSCLKRSGPRANGRGSGFVLGGPWRRLKTTPDPRNGRKHVTLTTGRRRQVFVHTLVLEAFVGPCPEGLECCHADDDSGNNALSNLRWDTHLANCADRIRNDGQVRGERHGRSRFTAETVLAIRAFVASGQTQQAAADKFGTNQAHIWRIVNRKRWAHIT